MSPPSNQPPPSIDDKGPKTLPCCQILCFLISITLSLSITVLIVCLNTPPNPSVSLLSVTSAADTATTSATTPTGGSFTTQNITAVFSISSRNKAAVNYTHLRLTGYQEGTCGSTRDFISAASIRSLVQSGPSTDTIAFDQPNSTVVINSWAPALNNNSVRTGFSALELTLDLRARYVRKGLTVRVWADCNHDQDFFAGIVVNGQDAPQLYFTRRAVYCYVTSTRNTLVWIASPCLFSLVLFILPTIYCLVSVRQNRI